MKKLFFILALFFCLNAYSQIYTQELPMWCWASCIQSVLFQANVQQTQVDIPAQSGPHIPGESRPVIPGESGPLFGLI
jgi:hypothetical protein